MEAGTGENERVREERPSRFGAESPHRPSGAGRVRTVEVLTFAGCPNAEPVADLVRRIVREGDDPVDVVRVAINDAAEAKELRFLGSPSVRIDGRDVEPGADDRSDYSYACRVYRTPQGQSGLPSEEWIRVSLVDPVLADGG